MKKPNYMMRFLLLLAGIYIVFISSSALAAGSFVPLSKDDVSVQKIKTFFDNAFISSAIDKDNDLVIRANGLKTFIRLDKKKMQIRYFSVWGLKSRVSEFKKLKFVNNLNNKLILVRFSMLRPTTLLCEFSIQYEGGVIPYNIINSYRTFASVVKGAALQHDPEDIIGSD